METHANTSKVEEEVKKWATIDDHDLSDSDEDYLPIVECDLCCKEFSSVKMYEQHLNSKKHFQMVSKRKLRQKVGRMETQNDEASNTNGGDVDPEADDEELACEICSKVFSGYIPYATHLKSNVHAKNLKKQNLRDQMKDLPEVIAKDDQESDEDGIFQKPFAQCAPCKKMFYDPVSFKQHMKSALHKKKQLNQKTIEGLKSQITHNTVKSDDEMEDFYKKCHVCDKTFSGPVPYKMHLRSSIHEKELRRAQLEDQLKDFFTKDSENQKLVCKECKKPFTDALAFKSHLENNSHGKQKAKDEVFSFVSSFPEIVAVKSVQNHSSDEENQDTNYQLGSYFFVCKLCHLSFSGPEGVRDHVNSKKHAQIKKEKEDRKKLQKKSKENQNQNMDDSVKKSDHVDSYTKSETSNSLADNLVELPKKFSKESVINEDFEMI